MNKKTLLLAALVASTVSAPAYAYIPYEMKQTIDMQKVSEAAAQVAMQCIHILKHYGAKGIEIVKQILNQVPELADQVRIMLRNAGYKI